MYMNILTCFSLVSIIVKAPRILHAKGLFLGLVFMKERDDQNIVLEKAGSDRR